MDSIWTTWSLAQCKPCNVYFVFTRFFPTSVRCRYNYTAQSTTDLSFQRGDIIKVEGQHDTSWWKGELNEELGLFPCNYVRGLDNVSFENSDADSEADQVSEVCRGYLNISAL